MLSVHSHLLLDFRYGNRMVVTKLNSRVTTFGYAIIHTV